MVKECIICGIEKDMLEFPYKTLSHKERKDTCKKCMRKFYAHENYKRNRKKKNKQSRQYCKDHPEKCRRASKKYCENHKEQRRIYHHEYYLKNKDRYLKQGNKDKRRYRSTIRGNLDHRLSSSIRTALKENKKGRKWENLVGYTIEELKIHLEKQFTDGMTWEKFLRGEIWIDHIKPISKFNYVSSEDIEFKECWSLNNLQPLWAKDNRRKYNKYMGGSN